MDTMTMYDAIKQIDEISDSLIILYPGITSVEKCEEESIKAIIKNTAINLKYISYMLAREALNNAD